MRQLWNSFIIPQHPRFGMKMKGKLLQEGQQDVKYRITSAWLALTIELELLMTRFILTHLAVIQAVSRILIKGGAVQKIVILDNNVRQ